MSLFRLFSAIATIVGVLVTSSIVSAKEADPAAVFASKLLLGDVSDAGAMISGDIKLTEAAAAEHGSSATSVADFIQAIGGCDLRSVRNVAPVSDFYDIAPEFEFVWDCKGLGMRARAAASDKFVTVTHFSKIFFVPPTPAARTGADVK